MSTSDRFDADVEIEAWHNTFIRQQARASALSNATAAVRVAGWSTQKDVEVTVDASGIVVDIQITARAIEKPAVTLGMSIVQASTAARAHLAARLIEIVEELAPEGDALTRTFMAQQVATLTTGLSTTRPLV